MCRVFQVYFELDKVGNLVESLRKETGSDVCSLAIAAVPEGRYRAVHCVSLQLPGRPCGSCCSASVLHVACASLARRIHSIAVIVFLISSVCSTLQAVGSYDNTVRMLSLDPSAALTQLTVQAVPSQPTSLALISMAG